MRILNAHYRFICDKLVNELIPNMQVDTKFTIVDVGCGDGKVLTFLEKKVCSFCIGIDINSDLMKKVHIANRKLQMILASAEKLSLRNDSVDLLILTHVLEHVKNDQEALSEVVRVLKDKGLFWFCSPKPLWAVSPIHIPFLLINGRRVGHVRSGYSVSEIVLKLKRSGFEILTYVDEPDLFQFLFYYYMLEILKRFGFKLTDMTRFKVLTFALKLDKKLPKLPWLGSGYSIIARKNNYGVELLNADK